MLRYVEPGPFGLPWAVVPTPTLSTVFKATLVLSALGGLLQTLAH